MKLLLFTFLLIGCFLTAKTQSVPINNENSGDHELTIFVLRSASPLDWQSPATLYKTYKKSLFTNFAKKERTLKGHFFIRLTTPLLTEPLYAGVIPANKKEEKKNFFVDKVGLSVFGIPMKGTIHGTEVTLHKISIHKKKGDIAYLKIRLSASAARQIIRYYETYTTPTASGFKPADNYGGAFWPLYESEGSGCSAFALAIFDLIDVHDFDTDAWKKTLLLPMNLIGGEMNNSKKVKPRSIKKTEHWASADGIENTDYIKYDIYDPTTAFYWILEQREQKQPNPAGIRADSESTIPGLFLDKSSTFCDTTAPIIRKRPDNNFFVDFYRGKNGIH